MLQTTLYALFIKSSFRAESVGPLIDKTPNGLMCGVDRAYQVYAERGN